MSDILFISVFNYGCTEIAENHIVSLLRCGIQNYLAYVTDEKSYNLLTKKGYKAKYYPIDRMLLEKMDFATKQFNEMSYIRYKIIHELLLENKIVWYLDVDTVVLQNLNFLVKEFDNFDLIMQDDVNMPCSGCMLFFPNKNSIAFTKIIYDSRTEEANDQILVLNVLRNRLINIKLILFNINCFPNGLVYFSELSDNERYKEIQLDFKKTDLPLCLVHANWMVGVDTKIKAIKDKNLWFI